MSDNLPPSRPELIERELPLATLGDIVRRAGDRSGRVVLVSGEAGIGKTLLLRRFAFEQQRNCSIYWGSCDALFTPRPLGPLHDIAGRLDGVLAALMNSDATPAAIFARMLGALDAHHRLPILVFEDVHWADKATLDLIKFLGRRITSVRALLLLSFRSDEVTGAHPLTRVLADFPPVAIQRLDLGPLSLSGIEQMLEGTPLDARHLLRITGGNPFFVSEIASSPSGAQALPVSIREALRARRARVGRSANAALDAVSVFPSPPGQAVLEWMLGKSGTRGCEACVAAGLLVAAEQGGYRFRHELARMAVLEDLSEAARKALHAKAAKALVAAAPAGEEVRPSELVHHARGAGDAAEVLRLAPLAAADAARVGAHAQAAQHLAAALEHVASAPLDVAAQLHESWSYEAGLAVKIDDSIIAARHRAIELWRAIGRNDKVGLNLRWLGRMHWYRGEAKLADEYLTQMLEVLEALPPGRELATAYAVRAQMSMLQRRNKDTVLWGQRAIELARRFEDMDALAHALNTVGSAKMYGGQTIGLRMLEESLALSLEHELHEQAARAYTNIVSCAASTRNLAVADDYAARGIKFDSEHDLDSWTHYLVGLQTYVRLHQGRLVEARDIAESVLRLDNQTVLMRAPATITVATVRARMGEDADDERLQQALAVAVSIGEIQYLLPTRLALLEASWLRDDKATWPEHLAALAALPLERLNPWDSGDVAVWFDRCGVPDRGRAKRKAPSAPRRLELAGRHREAGEALLVRGLRYDAAMTFAHACGDDVASALVRALGLFEEMEARPGAEFVRRRAESLGLAGALPKRKRGPYAKTRAHPLGLTGREVQILRCVKDGLSNREISLELQRSERTIEHHISALLAKLGVRNRLEALLRVQTEPWLLGDRA
jgi:DNA-binding CsgD family transcriptional regulator/tetratricopeptide (TPR) repeat protein